jgi:hypothetical protein
MQNQPFPEFPAGATVAQYVTKRWGIKTRLVPLQSFAVLTTASRIIRNNPRRFGLTVLNQGTGIVFLGWDASVSITNGLLLPPSGGSISLVVDEDAELITYDMWAIAAAAGNNLSIWETESL